ncbi:MAG TPA: hypothetical protein VKB89_23620 [Xanthobacteraceae bacterium]|nr:hypothetical protein [Xanthobacteraceae bacterium]
METTDLVLNTITMPLARPALPRRPYHYGNREHFSITNRTDREERVS